MRRLSTSAFEIAQRYVGLTEVRGAVSNPQILAMLRLDSNWPEDDDVPWCSAFVNYVCHLLRLPRSKSLRARSWLSIGEEVQLDQAEAGFDVVVLKRGGLNQPGPEVIAAPGHVGFFAGWQPSSGTVQVLGGNQNNSVSIAHFPVSQILSVRRLA